ncbi:hypothetical protein [Micromonospora psammae]|uniref:hypothetical protein n=1 Tax=Micromonospora sp. CPCC 205556 TaxID=3122398 RepID=UPI002FEEB3DC
MSVLMSRFRPSPFGARLMTLLLVALTVLTAAPAPAQAVAVPPGGRANYVVALMRNVGTESFVRLAEYSLRSDGTARADYWAWNAKTLSGRAETGFTTAGCAQTCKVYTAAGFESDPKQLYGTWSVSGSDLTIQWTTNSQTERWKFSNMATVTKLDLASHPTANRGFGWGSTVHFRTGVSVTDIYNAHGTYTGPGVENNYGTITEFPASSQTIHHPDAYNSVRLCNVNCMNLSTMKSDGAGGVVPSNKVYLAGNGLDRKMYYNHQLYEVNADRCIGTGTTAAGHLKPALQIIDDNGAFRGLVVVEASLYSFSYGGNILGVFDLNDI